MILSLMIATTNVSRTTEAIENQRLDVREMVRPGFMSAMASFVIPTSMPSSGLTKMLTLNTAATPANEAASPASGCRPTLR